MFGWKPRARGELPGSRHISGTDRAGLDPLTSRFAPGTPHRRGRLATRRIAVTAAAAALPVLALTAPAALAQTTATAGASAPAHTSAGAYTSAPGNTSALARTTALAHTAQPAAATRPLVGSARTVPATALLKAAPSAVPGPPSGWTTVFSDDFNGSASSPVDSQWMYDTGPGSNFGTGEIETMTNSTSNVYLDGNAI